MKRKQSGRRQSTSEPRTGTEGADPVSTAVTEKRRRLRTDRLFKQCPKNWLSFRTTADLQAPKGTVGQRRALTALEFGLEIRKKGYNVFAVGLPGTGKATSVRRLLERRSMREKTPPDICYVFNFDAPQHPRVLLLPSGRAKVLSSQMDNLVDDLLRRIPRFLSSKMLSNLRAKLTADFRTRVDRIRETLMQTAHEHGLWVQQEQDRLLIAPLVEGEPIGPADFESMPPEVKQVLEQRVLTFQQRIANFERAKTKMEREVEAQILEEEKRAIEPYVDELIEEIVEAHRADAGKAQWEPLAAYLEEVRGFILDNHRSFITTDEGQHEETNEAQATSLDIEPGREGGDEVSDFVELQVNVLVDNGSLKGAPVVFERHPTRQNLLGYLEYRDQHGALQTDHTLVRPGALHRANGGYLVLQAAELDEESNAWSGLRRALDHERIGVAETREEGQRLAGRATPHSMALDVKVVLLCSVDNKPSFQDDDLEFERLFKVKADFEESFPRRKSNVMKLARFMAQVAREEKLRPFDRGAVGRVVEFCARQAEDQKRLSARLALVVDLMGEADYWAQRAKNKTVGAVHVKRALAARRERHSKLEDQIMEEIRQGQLLIDTRGSVVGQINGIAVYDMGDHVFGVPSRITARTYVGGQGVVNIDREVKLSGAIHDKGALILVGYLGGRFAIEHRLALSASITFEQSYEEVEGDSASATELFALLSSLADVPIRQAVAATGSVNQNGELQPIGAVNEKIEGVYRLCKSRKLTGEQGVIIPQSNVSHLMLDREVVAAVKKKRFQIWAVRNVDEGMEILTGYRAGKQRRDGSWTPGSINDRVARRLASFAQKVNACRITPSTS
jgi:lon-related putative ATP-dependent protease